MPTATTLDPERFAMLIARFDTVNPNEPEALNAARPLRRAAADAQLRIIDAIGRADVMRALDLVMQPIREDSQELQDAFGKIAELAEELTHERETTAQLRTELATIQPGSSPTHLNRPPVNGQLVAGTILLCLLLSLDSVFR